MKIYTNGCSFTWGGGLVPSLFDNDGLLLEFGNQSPINQQRLSAVWPSLLGKMFGAESVVNDSMGCGSNDRIVRTTFSFFNSVRNQDFEPQEWLAVIQWTHPERFEYHHSDIQQWCMNSPSWTTFEAQVDLPTEAQNFKTRYYQITSDKHHSERMWVQILSLANFFKANKIRYMMTQLDNHWIDHLDRDSRDAIFREISWLGQNARLTLGDFFQDKLSSGHPSDLGHKEIARNFKRLITND